ncbi:hypothetical protein [Pseudonocardia acaciae]|uniref:hypothetical protein n=1 Tax=Pseudonocardia acaciae TaxID=551276 RepID=UPI00048C291C|nr:hypothetical protein [Pseudonocardia acaciae]
MCTELAVEHLERGVEKVLAALEVGDWRAVLQPDPTRSQALPMSGPGDLVKLGVMLRIVARSMELQTQGDVTAAWSRLAEAAGRLPIPFRRVDRPGTTMRAVLATKPRDAASEVDLAWRVARVIWREQYELAGLRAEVALATTARDKLVHACVEHLCWIEFDPFTWYRGAGPDRTSIDRRRSALCSRGTRLRQFAHPREGAISQSVWHDIGLYRGLCAEALGRLAERDAAAPWCGRDQTADLKVRRGRLRAWEFARKRRDDLDY